MTSGWLFLAAVVGIVLTGVVLEVWQRRIVRHDMNRRRQHRDLMRHIECARTRRPARSTAMSQA